MSVKVENLEHNVAKLTIEVPAADFEKAIDTVYNREKKNIAIPGFRKGKVPRKMIEKMYGRTVFFEDAANEIIPTAYAAAAEESGLNILTRPVNVTPVQFEPDKDFIFSVEVAVYPAEIKVGEYKGIEVPICETEVTEDDIAAELKKQQDKNSRTVSVDRPAEMGDTTIIDFCGTIDGVEFEGGKGENHTLKLGSNSFIPGFEAQLVGVKAGESKDVVVTFPEDYHAAELAGKEAVFACTVNTVQTEELPELDDEFASEVSEFETLDAYKESIAATLKEQKEKMAKSTRRQYAVEKVAEAAEIDIPEILIRDHAEKMTEDFAQRIESNGLKFQEYLGYMGITVEQMIKQNEAQAARELRNSFVLAKIAEIEGVEATDEQVEEQIQDMAKAYNIDPDQYKSYLPADYAVQMKEEMRLGLAADIVGDAAVETEAATKEAEEKEKALNEAAAADALAQATEE